MPDFQKEEEKLRKQANELLKQEEEQFDKCFGKICEFGEKDYIYIYIYIHVCVSLSSHVKSDEAI
jgi:hypothetical protein